MSEAARQRLITLLATGIAYGISRRVADRFIDVPEQRGIKDDVLEAALKGATTVTSTIIASVIVRGVIRN